MDITLYIIDEDGHYLYKRMGNVTNTMTSVLDNGERFTLTPPPKLDAKWVWVGTEWESTETEADLKKAGQDEIWEGIKAERLKQTTSGVYVPSVDKVFHTDETSVIQYNNIGNMIALGNFEPIQWKVMDNSWITMTEEVFKDLQRAMVQNTNRIYQVAEEHKAKMLEMDNPEDYDYSEGWDITEPSN